MTASVWDRPELKENAYDPSNPFLSKAIAPGEKMKLKLIDILPKVRPDDTKIGKPGDTFNMVCCLDEQGKEKTIDQNSAKGKFISALRKEKIELGDSFIIAREGEGLATDWVAQKLGADGLPVPEYVPTTAF